MKAVVFTEYGPPEVLQLKEVEKPDPKENEVLIKVHASTVSSGDYEMRASPVSTRTMAFMFGFNFGLMKPKYTIIGNEVAGEIETVGKNVKLFNLGDQVFGVTAGTFGANAEYVCVPEDAMLALKPANLTYAEAAAVPHGSHSALYFLREKANVQSGQKVLIYGASGSVGTYAVQLAKYFGAEVTGVCSTANIDMVRSIGADHVIDYTKEDYTESELTYDVIYETVGKSSFSRSMGALKEEGIYIAGRPSMSQIAKMAWTSMTTSKKMIFGAAEEPPEDLLFIKDLIEAGKLRPVIDRTYPLDQIVEAHRYADTGHKKGNVVITVEHNNKT